MLPGAFVFAILLGCHLCILETFTSLGSFAARSVHAKLFINGQYDGVYAFVVLVPKKLCPAAYLGLDPLGRS